MHSSVGETPTLVHGSFDSGAVRSTSSSTGKRASIREALKPWERVHWNGYGG